MDLTWVGWSFVPDHGGKVYSLAYQNNTPRIRRLSIFGLAFESFYFSGYGPMNIKLRVAVSDVFLNSESLDHGVFKIRR